MIVLLSLWKMISVVLSPIVFPAPESVLKAFGFALMTTDFWHHFFASAYRVFAAIFIAWSVGFPLGIVMGYSKTADHMISPFVQLTYPIPKIVFLPVVLLIFGLGDTSKILIISLILGYQVLVTTRDGVKGINQEYLKSIRSLGANPWQLYREGLIPASLPYGFTALRLNTGVSVAVLFFVESFATNQGLGYLIMDAWGLMDYNAMFTGIFGMSLLGVIINELVNLLEKLICPWFKI
ncbi:MAG: ABC transporter permease [Desulfobacteraceae bacterium]|nr:ABC transporter permease [Desulfobacteraceae bacterium]